MTDPVPLLFDRASIAAKRDRAARMTGDAFLVREAAEGVAYRLGAVNREFQLALDLDSHPAAMPLLKPLARNWEHLEIGSDETVLVEEGKYDAVVSVLSLHSVSDLPGLLLQIRRVLKPDGIFMAALFAGSTLTELRQSFLSAESNVLGGTSPRVAPFADIRDLGTLLQRAGFALPVADLERTIVRYRDLAGLAADLRVMADTNSLTARHRGFMSRRILAELFAHYAENFSDPDGRLRVTFEIAYLTGWSPHESQQKPLKPGSAKQRLADALGTAEHRLKPS